jgi:hypothetical protein
MSDAATGAAEALEELRAELDHADTLITEQRTRIGKLERHIRYLQVRLNFQQGAA